MSLATELSRAGGTVSGVRPFGIVPPAWLHRPPCSPSRAQAVKGIPAHNALLLNSPSHATGGGLLGLLLADGG